MKNGAVADDVIWCDSAKRRGVVLFPRRGFPRVCLRDSPLADFLHVGVKRLKPAWFRFSSLGGFGSDWLGMTIYFYDSICVQ